MTERMQSEIVDRYTRRMGGQQAERIIALADLMEQRAASILYVLRECGVHVEVDDPDGPGSMTTLAQIRLYDMRRSGVSCRRCAELLGLDSSQVRWFSTHYGL